MGIFGVTDFGLFCAAVLLLNATPGPDTAFIVGRSIAQGRQAGLVSALGISVGCCVHALVSALGLGAMLAASAVAFGAIKLAGGMYLIYLGVRMVLVRSAVTAQAPRAVASSMAPVRTLTTVFRQAMVTNLLNPKVVLFFLSFFPQFVSPHATNKTAAFLLLGLAFLGLSTAWGCMTALVAGTLARRITGAGPLRFWLERTVGAAFIGLGARIALTRN